MNELKLIPRKIYPCCSLKDAFTRIVTQPGFLNKCDHWRGRSEMIPYDILANVYDGQVWQDWQDFATDHYDKFLLHPGCDWFQPFSNTQYSVGVIYLTVLNLPRKDRYSVENILVSVIPGPKEPKLTLNPLLAPIIQELKSAYEDGWMVKVNDSTIEVLVHIRACVSCDLPAMRKVCGFLGHTARKGCSKSFQQKHLVTNQIILVLI